MRQYSTSSEGNDEKGDKDGKKPSANDLIYCKYRDQARGRLGRNSRPRGRNFALNGTQGEVGVSLKKKKKIFFFFFFFFLGRLIFILSPHKYKLW